MRGDIGQYPAIGRLVKEPVGPGGQIQPMRAQTDGLNHRADGPFGDQFRSTGHSRNLETFGKIDRPDAACLGHAGTQRRQLVQRRAARLVCHHILAGLHRRDGHIGAPRRDIGNQDHVDLGILQERLLIRHPRDIGKPLDEPFNWLRLTVRIPAFADASMRLHVLQLTKDMPVVNSNHANSKGHVIVSNAMRRPPSDDCSRAAISLCTTSAMAPVTRGSRSVLIASAKSAISD